MISPGGRLVFVHPSDELYGADRVLLDLLGMVPAGVQAEVWLPTDLEHPAAPLCDELTRRGVAVRHLDLPILRRAYGTPAGLARLVGRLRTTAAALRDARPSAVYCTTSAAFLVAPVARAAGVRLVVGHIQEIWSPSDRKVLTLPARSCSQLLAISEAVAQTVPASLRARITVVPNATPEPAEVVALATRSGPLTFVVASRWSGWKGHGTLIAAWDAAGYPGRLVVLGGPPPSGEAVDVHALVGRLRQPETVSIVGEVTDAARYINDADVMLVPSDRPEPFGLVTIEAFARGRPVIASAAGGPLEVITPGHDGWLFPPGDVQALAGLLSGLTREAVTVAGQKARDTYEARFTTERYAAQWRAAVANAPESAGRGKHP